MTPPSREAHAIVVGGALILIALAASFGVSTWKDRPQESAFSQLAQDSNPITYLSSQEISKLLTEQETLILDIRNDIDHYANHPTNSIQVDASTIASWADTFQNNYDNDLVLLVGSSSTSKTTATIARYLTKRFPEATFFVASGGFEAWKENALPAISAGDPTDPIDQAKVTYITPQEALRLIATDASKEILDVRNKSSYTKDHITPSLNIPLSQLEDSIEKISRGTSLIVYGADALESFQAGVRLFDLGFFQVETVDGGYESVLQLSSAASPSESTAPEVETPQIEPEEENEEQEEQVDDSESDEESA